MDLGGSTFELDAANYSRLTSELSRNWSMVVSQHKRMTCKKVSKYLSDANESILSVVIIESKEGLQTV